MTDRTMFEPESLPMFFDRMRRDHGVIITPPDGAGLWEISFPDSPTQALDTGAAVKRALVAHYPKSEDPDDGIGDGA